MAQAAHLNAQLQQMQTQQSETTADDDGRTDGRTRDQNNDVMFCSMQESSNNSLTVWGSKVLHSLEQQLAKYIVHYSSAQYSPCETNENTLTTNILHSHCASTVRFVAGWEGILYLRNKLINYYKANASSKLQCVDFVLQKKVQKADS